MKVTIITVCYNSEKTIEDTIKSVLDQVYTEIEYIVIDGGSQDETKSIIEKYRHRIDRFISEPDDGLYDAMNKGVELATGDVVGTLNSDDVFVNEFSVEKLMSGFSGLDVDAVYADLVYVKEDDVNVITRMYGSRLFRSFLIRFGFMLPHPTFYMKKSLFDEVGYYKVNYRVAADFEFITRCIMHGVNLARVDEIIVKMREGGISSRGMLWRIHQNFEIVRACKENGIYSNILLVSMKLPYKIFTILTRKLVKVL